MLYKPSTVKLNLTYAEPQSCDALFPSVFGKGSKDENTLGTCWNIFCMISPWWIEIQKEKSSQ